MVPTLIEDRANPALAQGAPAPRRTFGPAGALLAAALSLPSCSASYPTQSTAEQHEMANKCEFSDSARAKLVSLGFFDVGDDQELFLDREVAAGALGNSAATTDGAKWFYAYPRCSDEPVSYADLPNLLRSNVQESDDLIQMSGQTIFVRQGFPADLVILSFDDFRVAFYLTRR